VATDSNGSTTFSSNYQPYGAQYGASGTDPVYKYTRKPQSPVTGLYYYGARWYDQNTGRFLTRDPNHGRLSNPQSQNLYIYVLDRPTSLTDPTGLYAQLSLWAVAGCSKDFWRWLGCQFGVSPVGAAVDISIGITADVVPYIPAIAGAIGVGYETSDFLLSHPEIITDILGGRTDSSTFGGGARKTGWTERSLPVVSFPTVNPPVEPIPSISDTGIGLPGPWSPMPKKPPAPVYVPPQNTGKEGAARGCSALAVAYGLFVVGAFYAQAEKEQDSLGPLVSGAILSGATAPLVYAACYFLAPG